ncbi:caspase, EACC1-associated type [Amycolatopsis sp. NBC_00438]|uniref:caspase, EACC1-associated type n=1 Tax=Amycolatopsis sp. NBC_00438 TaxID=2903558 RepID=UPI002E20B283
MTELRAAGSRAVLIGTGCATGGSGAAGLDGVPAVAATVTDLAAVLVERCGMAAGNVRVLLDPALPFDVGAALAEETRHAEDALVVFFCGHGLVSLDGELYLATAATDTRAGYLAHTAVAYGQLRNAVLASPARVKIVILDCCYSGRAFATLGDTAGPEATGLSRIHGGYVLTAAGANEAALAPPGERYTAFGGALIRLLTEGDPDGPRELTLQHAHTYLREMLPARGFPRPRRLATESADGFVLALNPAYRLAETEAETDARPAGPGGEDVCPYRGLAAFDTRDTPWFFGRADETRTLLDRIAKARPGDPPLTLVGPSGVGKSSLLRAGVVAGAAAGAEPRDPVVFTPGPRPLVALYEAVAGRRGSERLLLVVDQLEEIFTECADRQERDSFVETLTAGPGGDGLLGDAVVVLGLRADFYRHCLAYPGLRHALETDQVLLGPLSGAELATAVQAPAAAAGLTLQAGLAQIVLQDVRDQAEALAADKGTELDLQQGEVLPLLSHALRETWARRQGRLLTVTGYANAGRVARAVETSAERVHDALDESGRAVLRALALRLASVQQGMAITRRLVARDTLVGEVAPEHRPTAGRVLDALGASGLLVAEGDAVGLAHSAVLRAWPRLRTWLEDGRQSLLVRRRLATAAQRWHDENRRRGLLYRGTQLTVAGALAEQGDTPLPAPSRAFLDASTARRRRVRRRRAVAVAAVAVAGASAVVYQGVFQAEEGCPAGLQTSSSVSFGDECVGVTAGTYVFRPELAAVEGRIAHENDRVGTPAVTVALLAPFPVAEGGIFTVDSMRRQLEGAHTAQLAANRAGANVRLVLANEGASEGAWEPVVGRLGAMTADPAPLVGVIGMGVSSAETLDGARVLSDRGLPVVAGLVTADNFDQPVVPGLLRVRPSNRQLAAAMARYVQAQGTRRPAMLVGDTGPGALYAQTLTADIRAAVRPHVASMDVFGYLGSRNKVPATFGVVVNGICVGRPASAFFAGQQEDLTRFLDTLAARNCGPIEVLAPEPGDGLLDPARRTRLAAARITVTAFVPAGWSALGPRPGNPARYQRYLDDFGRAGFDQAGAATGEAVSQHDAMATLTTAIAAARSSGQAVDARAVTAQLANLQGPLSVPGAEEDLGFTEQGTPAHRTIAIVRYADGQPPQTIGVDHTE